ncbi:MAG: pyrroline-5-carboxylate reductase [Alphaproteobacteria bacterium]|nr:pyrroline-5-carboxylate reductase [Alphaproteobacteria bacterium]
MKKGLLLIGCGNMGASLLKGWCAHKSLSGPFWVVNPTREKVEPFMGDARVHYVADPNKLQETPQVIICAVKPSRVSDVLACYRNLIAPGSVFCTVAAALPLSYYQEILGGGLTLVRVMPNLPVAAGVGQSLYCGQSPLLPHVQRQVEQVFGGLGKVLFVSDEKALDLRTPLTGCGPGFLFKIIESFARAAETLGVETEEAKSLARDLFIGTAKFLEQSTKEVSTLRQEVASPQGMTEAGYEAMDKAHLDALIESALLAALTRSHAMEKEYTHAG